MPSRVGPFSVRLSSRVDSQISEEARRTRRSKGSVLESLADEALRCRRFPGIGFRDDDWNRRAWLISIGWDVWEVVQAFQDHGSVGRLVAEEDLPEPDVRLALAYYHEFPEEIDRFVAENRRPAEELLAEFPHARAISTSV
jgi:hypothetical protein